MFINSLKKLKIFKIPFEYTLKALSDEFGPQRRRIDCVHIIARLDPQVGPDLVKRIMLNLVAHSLPLIARFTYDTPASGAIPAKYTHTCRPSVGSGLVRSYAISHFPPVSVTLSRSHSLSVSLESTETETFWSCSSLLFLENQTAKS